MKLKLLLLLPTLIVCGCSNNNPTGTSSKAPENESNVLVAYFSATNNTKELAQYAANHLDCDSFEIIPSVPYTADDLDYSKGNCRATNEQNDASLRPAISNQVEDMSKYDTVVLGYPIWAMKAPRIIFTFLESYSFEGKKILPFCTSGSSDISVTIDELTRAVPTATWLEGKRFPASPKATETEFVTWLDSKIQ